MRLARGAAVGAMLALGLTACSTVPYSDETGELAKAAQAFKTEASAPSPTIASGAATTRLVELRRLTSGGEVGLYAGCDQQVSDWRNAYLSAQSTQDQDKAYKAIGSLQPCAGSPVVPASDNPTPSQQVVLALGDYFDGLQAIVDAKDSTAVATASEGLGKSLSALATSANAPAPLAAAPGFFAKLAKMSLAQAQYEALRRAVLDADPLFDAAAPALIQVLRIGQSQRASIVAQDASIGVTAANAMLNDPGIRANGQARLQIYGLVTSDLDTLVQAQTAVRGDPAGTARALVKAHHKLAEALKSNRGQFNAVVSSLTDIIDAFEAFKPAPSGAAKTAGGQ